MVENNTKVIIMNMWKLSIELGKSSKFPQNPIDKTKVQGFTYSNVRHCIENNKNLRKSIIII